MYALEGLFTNLLPLLYKLCYHWQWYVFSNMLNACFILQTVALAREYYGCDDIEGVYLENEGGSGTARLDKILLFTDLIVSCI